MIFYFGNSKFSFGCCRKLMKLRHLVFLASFELEMSHVLMTTWISKTMLTLPTLVKKQVNWSFSCSTTTSNEAAGNNGMFAGNDALNIFAAKIGSLVSSSPKKSALPRNFRWSSWRLNFVIFIKQYSISLEKAYFFDVCHVPCGKCKANLFWHDSFPFQNQVDDGRWLNRLGESF